jgi:adenylate cyclase
MTPTILVVDDEPDLELLVTQKFRRQIRRGDYIFLFAHDGQEALEVIEREPEIDVVLSDINMPRMDGLTLLKHLKDLERNLKAVVVSAYGDMSNIRTAMNAGAFDFITKPIDLDDLETTLKKTLDDLAILREALERRAVAEHERENLARYFPPDLVDELAETDDPFASARERDVAVMFADIIGFTKFSATTPAEEVFEMLRDFHDRMAACVFANHGVVDKYLGDGLMATFGSPESTGRDASNALAAGMAMQDSVKELNKIREEQGKSSVAIAIGIHYGPVLLGNIGNENRLEYATVGDTVNVASRLEALARPLSAQIVISEAAAETIVAEGSENLLQEFAAAGQHDLRGSGDEISVRTLS